MMTMKRSVFVSGLTGCMVLAAVGVTAAPNTNAAAKAVAEVPGLPRVLIIGDSISIGYTPFVKELFKGHPLTHACSKSASAGRGP